MAYELSNNRVCGMKMISCGISMCFGFSLNFQFAAQVISLLLKHLKFCDKVILLLLDMKVDS